MIFSSKIVRKDIFDFVVCGGGPSGFATALAAARKGLKTALVERTGCLGGVSTNGGISYFLGGRKLNEKGEHVRVVGGIFDELTDRLISEKKAVEPNTINLHFNPYGWYPRMASGIVCNDTALKIALDDMLCSANVRIYFYTDVISVMTKDDGIASVIVHNKDGIVALEATLFADCTGDGDVAAISGCAYRKGREEDGLCTPASLEMVVEHVDGNALVSYQNEHQSPKLIEIIRDLKTKGEWPFPFEIFVGMQMLEEDVFLINTLRQTRVDGTNEASLSKATIEGRKQSVELFEIMKKYFPGFHESRIRRICDWIGIRETRRIVGEKTLTTKGALEGEKYSDYVAATTYNFDLPDPLRPSYDPMMKSVEHPNAVRKHVVIEIPYGSLLPKGTMDNLIVAGRCISCEREVLGPVREMGPCMQVGQAAGTAASLALGSGNFKNVDVSLLQTTLWTDGVVDPRTLPFS